MRRRLVQLANSGARALQIFLQMLVNVSVIAGLVFGYIQLDDYRIRTSADLVLKFGEYLDDEPYLGISQALDTDDAGAKILQPDGPVAQAEIDRYLGTFETLGNLYREGLITCTMFKSDFSYYIQKIYLNAQLRSYIETVNADNLWPNLAALGQKFRNNSAICEE